MDWLSQRWRAGRLLSHFRAAKIPSARRALLLLAGKADAEEGTCGPVSGAKGRGLVLRWGFGQHKFADLLAGRLLSHLRAIFTPSVLREISFIGVGLKVRLGFCGDMADMLSHRLAAFIMSFLFMLSLFEGAIGSSCSILLRRCGETSADCMHGVLSHRRVKPGRAGTAGGDNGSSDEVTSRGVCCIRVGSLMLFVRRKREGRDGESGKIKNPALLLISDTADDGCTGSLMLSVRCKPRRSVLFRLLFLLLLQFGTDVCSIG